VVIVHVGEFVQEICPHFTAPAKKFIDKFLGDELNWADEHRISVAASVEEEILEGLKMNFTGECTEVGMYWQ
jgi:hypothetical protein